MLRVSSLFQTGSLRHLSAASCATLLLVPQKIIDDVRALPESPLPSLRHRVVTFHVLGWVPLDTLALGHDHSCGLLDGELSCWGDDTAGQVSTMPSAYTDIVMESDMNPHDFLALVPIVEGAGGCISDWQGKALTFDSAGKALASANQELHARALKVIDSIQ